MDEIIDYYKILAKRSNAPIMAYVTGVLKGDVVKFTKQLSEIDNVAGIKLTIADYYLFGRIREIKRDTFSLLNGPDEALICGLVKGADGGIGTTYNMLPKLVVSIYDEFMKGNIQKAEENQAKLNKVIDVILSHPTNGAKWKASMGLLGYDVGYTIEPRRELTAAELDDLKQKLQAVGYFDLV